MNGLDQLDDEYTGDSPNRRRGRLLGLLKSIGLKKEFSDVYSIDTSSFNWDEFQEDESPLEITENNTNVKVGNVLRTRPRSINILYNLESISQIESALELANYLDEKGVSYVEKPTREELSKNLSDTAKELSDLAKKLDKN